MDLAGIATVIVAVGTSCGGIALLVKAFRSPPAEDIKALEGRMERAEAYAADMEAERNTWRTRAGASEAKAYHYQRVLRHYRPDVNPDEELPA